MRRSPRGLRESTRGGRTAGDQAVELLARGAAHVRSGDGHDDAHLHQPGAEAQADALDDSVVAAGDDVTRHQVGDRVPEAVDDRRVGLDVGVLDRQPGLLAETPGQVATYGSERDLRGKLRGMLTGMKTVAIFVKGPGAGRESALRAFQNVGMRVTLLRDVTPIPHNGCRPSKRRRV